MLLLLCAPQLIVLNGRPFDTKETLPNSTRKKNSGNLPLCTSTYDEDGGFTGASWRVASFIQRCRRRSFLPLLSRDSVLPLMLSPSRDEFNEIGLLSLSCKTQAALVYLCTLIAVTRRPS